MLIHPPEPVIRSFEPDQSREALTEPLTLTVCKAELADLRRQIVQRAGWETQDSPTVKLRVELRSELARLRLAYFDKIDEIAMNFGVQRAMEAQEGVEKTIKAPGNAMRPSALKQEQKRNS